MSNIDLHIHSVYSDGTYTSEEIAKYAKEKDLCAIALTDHDTISGLDETRKQSEILGIQFINGVEINSCCTVNNKNINMHILGYMFDPEQLRDYMDELKKIRDEHNDRIMTALQLIGIDIDYKDLHMESEKSIITRLNFARTLVQKGYAESIKDALKKYLHKGGTAYVEFRNQPFTIVAQKIHEAGGVVSFAHPAKCGLDDIETENVIKYLTNNGLDAIECIHSSQDFAYTKKMISFAKKYNLCLTGGSDFHGKNDDGIDMGKGGDKMPIPEYYLTDLKVRQSEKNNNIL